MKTEMQDKVVNVEDQTWLTKKEAAAMVGFSEKTIDRAIKRGWIKRVQNGVRRVKIARSELMRWMNGCRRMEV